MRRTTYGSAHVIIIVALAVALIAALGVLFWQNVINKKSAEAATYAECVKASGSKIQTTYPEICVTAGGKSFTNPDQKVATSDKPVTKSFCAPIEKICFDYPENWSVKQDSVDVDNDSVAERISVNDETGHAWLSLQTGMSGLGGACGSDDDGSYAKILQTHTTAVKGSYLVNEAAKNYVSDTVYAVSWIAYNGTAKSWSASMALSNSNATQNVGKVDSCDVMFNYLNGKNAAWSSSVSEPGAMEFRYNINSNTEEAYNTEAEAAAFLSSSNAKKAYAVLQSVSYK